MEDFNLNEWKRWFQKYVEPVFDPEKVQMYLEFLNKIQAPFSPKYWIAIKFFERIKDDFRFDEELKRFFSFLYSSGFFMEYIITFEEWLNMPNWRNPSNSEINEETILDILRKENGTALLKKELRWLPFING